MMEDRQEVQALPIPVPVVFPETEPFWTNAQKASCCCRSARIVQNRFGIQRHSAPRAVVLSLTGVKRPAWAKSIASRKS